MTQLQSADEGNNLCYSEDEGSDILSKWCQLVDAESDMPSHS